MVLSQLAAGRTNEQVRDDYPYLEADDIKAALAYGAATDDEIFDWAAKTQSTIITADSDFAMLLAVRRARTPSVVLPRDFANQPPAAHAELLAENLPSVEEQLESGAIVSLSPTRLRVRDLPIQ